MRRVAGPHGPEDIGGHRPVSTGRPFNSQLVCRDGGRNQVFLNRDGPRPIVDFGYTEACRLVRYAVEQRLARRSDDRHRAFARAMHIRPRESAMPHPFAVHRAAEGAISVLGLEGHLDAHTAPEFERAIQAEIDADRVRIIVDGAQLKYISSAGLGVFMSFIEEVREKGGDIKICGLIPKVQQIFDILGFRAIYEIVDSRAAAVERFA
jgi:anti-sigma B factor antagonist